MGRLRKRIKHCVPGKVMKLAFKPIKWLKQNTGPHKSKAGWKNECNMDEEGRRYQGKCPGNTRNICGSDKMFARYFHVVIHLIILLTAVTKPI